MSRLPLVVSGVVTAGGVRQMFVLAALVRSGRFLRHGEAARPPGAGGRTTPRLFFLGAGWVVQGWVLPALVRSGLFRRPGEAARPPGAGGGTTPRFFIVVPVLREAAVLREAVAHFQAVTCGHGATVLVVTTAREPAETGRHPAAGDTTALARELAGEGTCTHVHYPDPLGLKGDQLNYAAACCAGMLPDGVPSSQAFLVCYDADSRPPVDSLARFTQAIAGNPGADVFHQSSRFEFRPPPWPAAGPVRRLRAAACGAGALRANRFVLGFTISPVGIA